MADTSLRIGALRGPLAATSPGRPRPGEGGRVPPAADADAPRLSPAGQALAAMPGREEAARAVMAGYDLRHIAYTDLVELAGALRDAGALRAEDYLDFIGPSPEHASLGGGPVADWNAPRDYVALHESQWAFLQASGAEPRFIAFAAYQLALFRQFDALHAP